MEAKALELKRLLWSSMAVADSGFTPSSHVFPTALCFHLGFPGGSDGTESACNAGDPGSVPGVGRSPGGGNGHPLQYSCLENSMDRGAWRATVRGAAKSQTQLSS